VGKLFLVQPGPGAPDLLPLEAWRALARGRVHAAPGDELGTRLAEAGLPVTALEEAAPERLRPEATEPPAGPGTARPSLPIVGGHRHAELPAAARALADRLAALAAEEGEVAFLLPREAAETVTRAVLERALRGDLEVEIVVGRPAPGARLLDLVRVMARLRGPGGCPWDREQTHRSLVRYLLDETYELIEAIEAGDAEHMAEELGDLLLQVVFHAQMAAEEGSFDIDDVAGWLVEKLVTRHPHVFGDLRVSGASEVVANWEVIKDHEKGRASVLEGVPEALPALAYAAKLLRRAARLGHDARAEAARTPARLERAARAGPGDAEEAIGELLLAVVALAAERGVDAETALRRAARGLRDRLARVERAARERGLDVRELPAEERARLWERASP
jgi:MazG family protein